MTVDKHILSVPGQRIGGGPREGQIRIEAVATDPNSGDTVVLSQVHDKATGGVILYSPDVRALDPGTQTFDLYATDSVDIDRPFAYRVTLELDHLVASSYPVYTFALTSDRDLGRLDVDDVVPTLPPTLPVTRAEFNDLLARIEALEAGVIVTPPQNGPVVDLDGLYSVGALTADPDGLYLPGSLVADSDGLYLIGA